jgi:hypothetical protein
LGFIQGQLAVYALHGGKSCGHQVTGALVISVEICTDGLSARIKTDAHYSPDLASDLVNRTVAALRDTVIHLSVASGSFEALDGEALD